jgi:hypothetical protein
MQCKFNKVWIGKCGKPADESGFCEEHKGVKCCSCGAQATRECNETGWLVCGAPLCDECKHNAHPEGHNVKIHHKKSE